MNILNWYTATKYILKHWDRDKIVAIIQTAFSNAIFM